MNIIEKIKASKPWIIITSILAVITGVLTALIIAIIGNKSRVTRKEVIKNNEEALDSAKEKEKEIDKDYNDHSQSHDDISRIRF